MADGERVELVGYVGRSHTDESRPVVFWYDGGKPVNQVLGSQLPARPLPVQYPDSDAAGGDGEQGGPAAAASSEGTSAAVVWIVLGVGLAAIVAGGASTCRRGRVEPAESDSDG